MERETRGQDQASMEEGQTTIRVAERCNEERDAWEVQEAVHVLGLGNRKAKTHSSGQLLDEVLERITQLYSIQPSKVYSQWKGNNMKTATASRRRNTGRAYGRRLQSIMASVASGSKSTPQQAARTEFSKHQSGRQQLTAPGCDLIHTYWLKKLIALHVHLAAQTNQLLMNEIHPEWLNEGGPGSQGSPERTGPIQLPANNKNG